MCLGQKICSVAEVKQSLPVSFIRDCYVQNRHRTLIVCVHINLGILHCTINNRLQLSSYLMYSDDTTLIRAEKAAKAMQSVSNLDTIKQQGI